MPVPNKRTLTIVAVLGIAGIVLMLLATTQGIGIDPDSTVYLDAAQNLLHGKGLSVVSGRNSGLAPLTHYPPLYSSLLALIGVSGMTVENAARILNAILFGGNIVLIGFAISLCARHSVWLPVVGAALALTAVDIAGMHSIALSEPAFIFFTLLGLLLLAHYFENQQRRFLIAAAFMLACSLLTRYVGIVSLLTGCLTLLTLRPGTAGMLPAKSQPEVAVKDRNLPQKLLDTLIFGAITALPLTLWVISNHFVTNATADRQLLFHPVKSVQLVSGFSTIAQWLLLGKVPAGIRAIGFGVQILMVAGLVLYLLRKGRAFAAQQNKRPVFRLPWILAVFIVVYILFLIFTASFIDADTVFDSRSLLPVHVAGIILVLFVFWKLHRWSGTLPFASLTLGLLSVLLVSSHSFRFTGWLVRATADGQGYASRTWTQSETIVAVKRFAPVAPIYSNGSEAIHYLTARTSIFLPEKIIHGTGRPNPNYETELDIMVQDIKVHDGVVVYFHRLPERSYFPSADELQARIPFQVFPLNDGSILKLAETKKH